MFTPLGKHPIVDPDLLNEASLEGRYICCLSERDVFIIRSYLFPFSGWPTRFARPKSGQRWEMSTGEEFASYQNDIQELDSKITGGDFMTCLEQGLSEIAQALKYMADRQCCEGGNVGPGGGVVSTYTDGNGNERPIYGSAPPATLPEAGYPSNYDSLEDYLLDKCKLANLVFDGWLLTIRGLATITVFNAIALAGLIGFALAGSIVLAPAAIPVMIGALIVLGTFVAMFSDIADGLQENKASIVCDLYNSSTVEEMTTLLSDAIDLTIEGLSVAGPIGEALKLVVMLLVNSDTLSQLLNGTATLGYPDADCSSCNPTVRVWDMCASQLVAPNEDGSFTVSSGPNCANSYGCDAVYFRIGVLEDGSFPETITTYKITATGDYPTGVASCRGTGAWNYFDYQGNGIQVDLNDQDTDQCTSYVFVIWDEPFSITFTYEAC